MIKGISITNFKGIGDPGIKIDLAPITLLFGNNSAGKSTIFHAFLYAYEVLVNRNLNADRTTLGGDNVDLGGFLSFVHDHDVENEVSIEIELDLASAQLDKEWRVSEYIVSSGTDKLSCDMDLSTIGTDVWEASVGFTIGWDKIASKPFAKFFSVSIDKAIVFQAWYDSASKEVISRINYRHSLFRWSRDLEQRDRTSVGILDELFPLCRAGVDSMYWDRSIEIDEEVFENRYLLSLGNPPKDLSQVTERMRFYETSGPAGWVQWFCVFDNEKQKANLEGALFYGGDGYTEAKAYEEWNHLKEVSDIDSFLPVKVLDQDSAIPVFDRPLQLNTYARPQGRVESRDVLRDLITRLVVGPTRILARQLNAFRHIGPLRSVPPRSFQRSLSIDSSRWCSGLAAWDTLSEASDEFVNEVSAWLSSTDRLGTGYSLIRKRFKELEVGGYILRMLKQENPLDELQIALDGIENLPMNQRLSFRDEESQVMIEPPDIAVGITQLLPVIVAAVDKHPGITLIEQPELHNHPAVEVGLGDLFVETINQAHCRFILETHGEHLMLRMLRRIRETTEGTLPTGIKGLLPDELAVYYIERSADGVVAKRLHIDVNGEFIDKWPKGFFRERSKELF